MASTSKISKTAELVAAARAYHTMKRTLPSFQDEYAIQLCGDSWRHVLGNKLLRWYVFRVKLRTIFPYSNSVTTRALFCEHHIDNAVAAGTDQFVLLGAGFDSFAMRRTDLASKITVYELDQPATQQVKRKRMRQYGITEPSNVVYVDADLNKADLFKVLADFGYDSSKPAIFSWFGVVYYLPIETVTDTFRNIAKNSVSGSEILFDYLIDIDNTPQSWKKRQLKLNDFIASQGEPFITTFNPDEIEQYILSCGFAKVDNPNAQQIVKQYCSSATRSLILSPALRFARAICG